MNINFDDAVQVRVQVKHAFPETTSYQDFVREITRLRLRVADLEKANSDYSWQTNPDRMGGAYSQDEINNAYAWK